MHHQLNGHVFEQAPGVGDGQGSHVTMGSQRVGHDWVTELNWTELAIVKLYERMQEKERESIAENLLIWMRSGNTKAFFYSISISQKDFLRPEGNFGDVCGQRVGAIW